jgi:hypothetical protein
MAERSVGLRSSRVVRAAVLMKPSANVVVHVANAANLRGAAWLR